ncbi:hypothetical protein CsSME_00021469 [Camellia sinensis var. sinensis]
MFHTAKEASFFNLNFEKEAARGTLIAFYSPFFLSFFLPCFPLVNSTIFGVSPLPASSTGVGPMTQQASPPRVETPGISQEVLWEALQEVEQAEANQQMMAQIRTERKAISDLMQTLTADGHFFPPQTPQHWGRVIKDVIRADFQQRNIPLHEWKPVLQIAFIELGANRTASPLFNQLVTAMTEKLNR